MKCVLREAGYELFKRLSFELVIPPYVPPPQQEKVEEPEIE